MFDRLSQDAKKTMSLARDAANRQQCGHIDIEHILIGILQLPASSGCRLLTQQGIDIESLLTALDTLLPRGSQPVAAVLPFTSDAKRILGQAGASAADLQQSHIGNQHLLLAILHDDDNDSKNILLRIGVAPDTYRIAMTTAVPQQSSNSNLLLISNSTMHGGGYLEHCKNEIVDFLGERKTVLFVPFALADHDGYEKKARESFAAMGHDLTSVHTCQDKVAAVQAASAIFIGGGNTFRLLTALNDHGLLSAIRARVAAGIPYIGSSAGTNVATTSIRTTNDMPIMQPPSFDALQLVPFQINPHYLDPNPDSAHMGETREERIMQFHEEHDEPVLGLREGCMLRVSNNTIQLRGTTDARLFRRSRAPQEFQPPCDMSFLLET